MKTETLIRLQAEMVNQRYFKSDGTFCTVQDIHVGRGDTITVWVMRRGQYIGIPLDRFLFNYSKR